MSFRKVIGGVLYLLANLLFVSVLVFSASCAAYAEETSLEPEENYIYDQLKERIETTWEKGLEQIEEADPIEITGNLGERMLRAIARGLFQNLKSIKAGALLIGVISFLFGGIALLLARRDKKIQRYAIRICMMAIPGLLLILVFGVSWFVSVFR